MLISLEREPRGSRGICKEAIQKRVNELEDVVNNNNNNKLQRLSPSQPDNSVDDAQTL